MIPVKDKITDVLLITVNFPTTATNKDGMGNYTANAAQYLMEETGWNIHAIAFRFSGQEPFEESCGLTVERIDPPRGILHYDELYNPHNFRIAASYLAASAQRAASGMRGKTAAWCHGYETGMASRVLAEAGFHVAGVVHYLIAQDLLNRFEKADDQMRKDMDEDTFSSIAGRIIPAKLRPAFIRLLSVSAPLLCKLPVPDRLELLYKLEQESLLMKSSRRIVAVSPGFGATIVRFYPGVRNKIEACVAGSPSPASGSDWPFPLRDDRLRLVMVGRPVPQKGWDYVAEALGRLESSRPDEAARVEFAVIGGLGDWGGDYSNRIYQNFLGLKKVSLAKLGEIPNDAVMRVMASADALLLPSTFEPFGLVMLEAMASGCMVLSSDCDGPRGVVRPPWGILMPFRNPRERVAELEAGINKLLSLTRAELEERGGAAREAAAGYSWRDCARIHAEALRNGQG
ncbi:MAG: hypothetical protein A3J42_03075 [Candidatus Dadabacteria bacterium RIFCSPHIGHO2_12_FULL_53_21]|nr:MAG: hypothetical protein A3J42_03075 [Candidatus Dadabacteria bacterium RIFCSPHIGHO2_12_FULL_53_21]